MTGNDPAARVELFATVVILENDRGAPVGARGAVLEDYGDGYEVEVANPDGSTSWLGGLPDHAVRPASSRQSRASVAALHAASSSIDLRSRLGQGSVQVVGVVAHMRLSTCVV